MKDRTEKGFTLIELMMALGIMGILAVVAAGYFGDSAVSAKRTDARAGLQTTAITLEKCKSLYGSYNSANCSITNGSSVPSRDGLYSIAVTSAASTFTLTATPSSGSSQNNDSNCTSLILNNLGKQSGTGSDPTTCW